MKDQAERAGGPAAGGDLRWGGGLFLFSLTVCAAVSFFFPSVSYDGLMYVELAKNFLVSGYEILGTPHEKFLPLYPWLMAVFDAGAGLGGPAFFGHLINVFCGAGLPVLIFCLGRSLGAGRGAAGLSGLVQLFCVCGLDQVRDVSVMPLYTFLFTLMLCLISAERNFWGGAAGGLGVLTRQELYLFLPGFFLWGLRERRLRWPFFLGFLLMVLPWWFRNFLDYGRFNPSKYFVEIVDLHFHLPEIGWGLVKEFGPGALILAAAGFLRVPRRWLFYLLGYGFLYIALHTVWWWYKDRFLMALAPVFLAPAGVGAEAVAVFMSSRFRIRRSLALWIIFGVCVFPLMVRTGWFVRGELLRPGDPVERAGRSLRDEPAGTAVLGGNLFLLHAYSGHPGYSWEGLPAEADPHKFVLELYQRVGVRRVLWTNFNRTDRERFGFLGEGKPYRAVVETAEGDVELLYIFLREYDGPGNKRVLIYALRAERISGAAEPEREGGR